MQNGGKFRNRKTTFTAASNVVLFDERLDMDTKTLHNMINYYISIPGFTLYKGHLQQVTGLGQKAFNRMWKQLKETGYLVQHKLKGEKGMFYYEYELFDTPQIEDEKEEDKEDEKRGKDMPAHQKASLDQANIETLSTAKVMHINKTLSNKTLNNKTIINKQQQDTVVVADDVHLPELNSEITSAYQRAFGFRPSPQVKEYLSILLRRFQKTVVIYALELAGSKGKGFDYAQGIFKKLEEQGAYTFDQVFAYEETYSGKYCL